MGKDRFSQTRGAQEAAIAALHELRQAVEYEFPVGRTVHFKRWGGEIMAEVKEVSPYGDWPAVCVENFETKKRYWIDYRIILRAEGQ